jgi:hypothetical protein
MNTAENHWSITLVFATLAVAFALAGLGLGSFYPGAAPLVSGGLLALSLGSTTIAFGRLAMRIRRLELENEGLIEEISQEFDRVKDKIEIFSEALAEPHTLVPEDVEQTPLRRVTVK